MSDFWRLERVDEEDGGITYELHCLFGNLITVRESNYDTPAFAKGDAECILKALNERWNKIKIEFND